LYYSESHNMHEMPNWLSLYLNGTHLHDEVEHHCGGDTEHWDVLFAKLASLSEKDIHLRTNEIKRLLQDSGVTHAGEADIHWRLDPLPLMLSEKDWLTVKQGVAQRVELLNRIADDLYGPQNLLLNGTIPAHQLQASDEYIRECFSLTQQTKVTLAAVDIFRDTNGQFKVLADHLQSPQGLGLLLENRIIARRVMGDEFSECNVQRIANFFKKFQRTITESTPSLRDPRVVILSKGPADAYYSEQAFLASYMGYTLVQSADLTVRKGKVWLKSLKGLRKVDVIVRWLSDQQVDSLEQNNYSIDGIAGLLQAVRQQSVKLINPLGCGILESPSVKSNIQRIANQLLAEPLILAEPETYPATSPQAQDIAENPSGYQLFSYEKSDFCLDGDSQFQEIQTTLAKNNHSFYFRQKVQLSTAPFWDDHALVAQPVTMRCFALVTDKGVEVLPSALCFANQNTSQTRWIKDTWVRSDEPLDSSPGVFSSIKAEMSDLALLDGVIPSRTAENLYWLGRFLERGENTVRMLRLLIDRFTEFSIYPDSNNKKIVTRLVDATVNQAIIYPFQAYQFKDNEHMSYIPREIAANMLFDKDLAGSLLNTLNSVVYNALQIRDLLSSDSWRIIDDIRDEIRRIERLPAAVSTRVMQTTADRVIGYLMAFNGSTSDSMSNSNGWFMLDIGRRVERSTQLLHVTQALLTDEMSESEQLNMLEAVLFSQVSLITHKRRYRMYQSIETGLELLLLDAEYPRSLLFQIEQLETLCKQLPDKSASGQLGPHHKVLLKMRTICHLSEKKQLAQLTQGQRLDLVELMQSVDHSIEQFSDMLMLQYFSHTKTAVPLNANLGSIPAREV